MQTQTTAQDTARRNARAIIQATTHQAATAVAAQLRGTQLAAVADLLGVTVYGPVASRRAQLVQHTVGVAFRHASIAHFGEPAEQAAFLARWRARQLAQLDA